MVGEPRSAADTRALLAEHNALFGDRPLALPYLVVDDMLASLEVAEKALERARRWKDRAWYAMTRCIAILEAQGGESRMLARQLRVLLDEDI